ncbi:MAG TPA: DNA repair protein RadC [Bacteroidales bacterium]|nr:DNA repair protein RadC [Bacteroidales bacterium]
MSELRNIKQWAEDDRPREKLIAKGKSALSDAELLAILLRSGSTKETAVDLSKRLLSEVSHNLLELSKLSLTELTKLYGIGEAKALSIIAALELGKRCRVSEVAQKEKISGSRDVFEYLQSNLADNQYEEFWILLLNRANKIIKKASISEGGIAGTVADPKKIFKTALENNATSIILCHNHPSGNIRPSEADIKLTKKLKDAGALMDISVLDHVIIGDNTYFSFADENLM